MGQDAFYVVDDDGFRRHIPSEQVDRQILAVMQEGVLSNREAVVEGMLGYLGKEDLFTKAAIETSIGQMGEQMEQLLNVGLPEDARQCSDLWASAWRFDVHGEVVKLDMPGEIEGE